MNYWPIAIVTGVITAIGVSVALAEKPATKTHTVAGASCTDGSCSAHATCGTGGTGEGVEIPGMTREEWEAKLTKEQRYILLEQGTERPFLNKYNSNKAEGLYFLAATEIPLFSSKHKFNSGTGWPSFWKPITESAVKGKEDRSHGMVRIETVCGTTGAHLGHVFPDGPKPTGQRYCINSGALTFVPLAELTEEQRKLYDEG